MEKYLLPRGYLSASQISTYLRCGMQYYFRYIEQKSSPPNIAMMTGSACHKGFETYYQDTIDEGEPSVLTGAQIAELAIAEIEEEAAEKEVPLVGEEKDNTVIEIQTAITSYIDHVAPKIVPTAVEKEITFDITENIPILAYIDLIRKKNDQEMYQGSSPSVICDYKVTGKKWALNQLTNALQFMLYAIGLEVGNVEIHNLRKTTANIKQMKDAPDGWATPSQDVTTNIRILRHTFDNAAEQQHIISLVTRVAEGITKGNFLPCLPDEWCCTPKWCGYWHLCRGK